MSEFHEVESIQVDHPDFRWVGERAVNGHPYVVFERSLYNRPAPEQVADYRERQATVERLGGRMCVEEYEIAGQTLAYTTEDCEAMVAATTAVLPVGWEVFDSWNGIGSRSYSVGIRKRP